MNEKNDIFKFFPQIIKNYFLKIYTFYKILSIGNC